MDVPSRSHQQMLPLPNSLPPSFILQQRLTWLQSEGGCLHFCQSSFDHSCPARCWRRGEGWEEEVLWWGKDYEKFWLQMSHVLSYSSSVSSLWPCNKTWICYIQVEKKRQEKRKGRPAISVTVFAALMPESPSLKTYIMTSLKFHLNSTRKPIGFRKPVLNLHLQL